MAQCVVSSGDPAIFDESNPVSYTCTVPNITVIDDVTLALDITHTWVGDIAVELTSPGGTSALVVDRPDPSCGTDDMRVTLTDVGTDGDINTCVPGFGTDQAYVNGGTYTTLGDASDIGATWDGEAGLVAGAWTLSITDGAAGDGGSIDSPPVLTVTGSTLPVELVSFEGFTDGDDIELLWTTATEENNAGFEIEHQIENGEFQHIGFIQGAGSTSESRDYTFKVNGVQYGNHQFRLKQIDFDGSFEYSETIEVDRELADGFALKDFYPNPFNPQGQFSLLVAEDQDVNIGVYNITGQLVKTVHRGTLAAQQWHSFTINAEGLPSGNYLVRAMGNQFVNTQQILLVK